MRRFVLILAIFCAVSIARATDFSVCVDGREVPVVSHRVRERLNCAYAQFVMSGTVSIEVRVDEDVKTCVLSPLRLDIHPRVEGRAIRFHLSEPRYLVLTVNGTRLLLFGDPEETVSVPGDAIDVTRPPWNADSTGASDATAAIQGALDEAGRRAGGALVVLPPGRYTTTGIRVPDNTRLHLPLGVVLQGDPRCESYPQFPPKPGRVAINALIRVKNAEHVRIFGYGTVDARGFSLAGDAKKIEQVRLKVRCLTIEDSSDVAVEGLLCRESTSWTVPFFRCTDVSARRVKVVNDLGPLKHSDGINLCAVRNGVVEDCFVHTTDDAYCAKGHRGAPCENLVFRRLVALSATRGLKCGMQAYETMRGVVFEQVDVVQTRDGIDLMHWDGEGAWSDIVFRDVRVEKCSRLSIAGTVREGGSISGVLFERISFDEKRPGYLRGKDAGHRIDGVIFRDIRMGGEPVTRLEDSGIVPNEHVGSIRFESP